MREMPYASVDRREPPPPSDTRDSSGGGTLGRRGPPVGGVPMFGTVSVIAVNLKSLSEYILGLKLDQFNGKM